MCNMFYIIKDWLELLSYVVTILGVVSVVIAIVVIIKNKLNPKNVQLIFKFEKQQNIKGYIEILNYTNREFTIFECQFVFEKKVFKLYELKSLYQAELKNIYVYPYSEQTLNHIVSELETKDLKRAKFILKTTQGNLIYKLNRRGRINFID